MAKDDKGKKGKKDASADDIMSTGDLRPLLKLAKGGKAISCVVCVDGDGEGVILLHKQSKPKKLRGELIKQAEKIDLELDVKSLRYGRASVDEGDEGVLRLIVHKDPSGSALYAAIKKRVKPAGFNDVLITADANIENEPEDSGVEESEAGESEAGEESATTAADGNAMPQPSAGAQAGAQAGAPETTAPPAAPPSPPPPAAAAEAAPPPAPPPAAPPPAAPPPAAPAAQAAAPAAQATAPAAQAAGTDLQAALQDVTKTLAGLMKLIPDVAAQAPEEKDHLIALAATANVAIKAGDPTHATAAAEDLERALKSAADHAAAAPAGAAANGGAARAAATLTKSGLAWTATRKAVENQIGVLHGKMTEAYKDHGFGADLDKFFKSKVEPVLEQLDESLVETLAQVGRATEAQQQKGLVEQAQKIVARYEGYLASEPLIKKLDNNPFVDLKIEETLTKTLVTLNKTLVSVASNLGH